MITMSEKSWRIVFSLLFCTIVLCGTAVADDAKEESGKNEFTIKNSSKGKGFDLHKQNYILPLTWGNKHSKLKDAEMKFQISLKQQLFDTNFYVGYTQKSLWTLLDTENSSPFRETNYNPELFYHLTPENNPISQNFGAYMGYEHESNGSNVPKSRSWDRLFIKPYFEIDKFRADLKVWYRFPEDDKEYEGDPAGDDNPDIIDYYGYGELELRYLFDNNHMLSMMGRWNMAKGNSCAQVDYSWPSFSKNAFFFVHLWTGYGESLIDYNHYITNYGFGIIFKR